MESARDRERVPEAAVRETRTQVRYKRAKPEDVSRAGRLLAPDRPLFSPATWRILPELIKDLIHRERVLLCALEDVDTERVVFLGASAFLQPRFLEDALKKRQGILEPAFAAEHAGRPAFLNYRQVAEANRRCDLRLVNFFGVPEEQDQSQSSARDDFAHMTGLWNFFHEGFNLREIWFDSGHPLMINLMLRIGMHVEQERTLARGENAKLFRYTREEAVRSTPSWPASAMFASRPRFGFTRGERRLLETALLDGSDRDAAAYLDLTTEGVKKRWRTIYRKVSLVEPGLLRPELSGADQRRALLQMLRHNLQELRPY